MKGKEWCAEGHFDIKERRGVSVHTWYNSFKKTGAILISVTKRLNGHRFSLDWKQLFARKELFVTDGTILRSATADASNIFYILAHMDSARWIYLREGPDVEG